MVYLLRWFKKHLFYNLVEKGLQISKSFFYPAYSQIVADGPANTPPDFIGMAPSLKMYTAQFFNARSGHGLVNLKDLILIPYFCMCIFIYHV